MALELKVDTKLSELQKYNLKQIWEAGGITYEATPTNWPSIRESLTNLSKGNWSNANF